MDRACDQHAHGICFAREMIRLCTALCQTKCSNCKICNMGMVWGYRWENFSFHTYSVRTQSHTRYLCFSLSTGVLITGWRVRSRPGVRDVNHHNYIKLDMRVNSGNRNSANMSLVTALCSATCTVQGTAQNCIIYGNDTRNDRR